MQAAAKKAVANKVDPLNAAAEIPGMNQAMLKL